MPTYRVHLLKDDGASPRYVTLIATNRVAAAAHARCEGAPNWSPDMPGIVHSNEEMRLQRDRVLREMHILADMARVNASHARDHDAPGVADNDDAIERAARDAASQLSHKLKDRL